jgi:hypothetical protein
MGPEPFEPLEPLEPAPSQPDPDPGPEILINVPPVIGLPGGPGPGPVIPLPGGPLPGPDLPLPGGPQPGPGQQWPPGTIIDEWPEPSDGTIIDVWPEPSDGTITDIWPRTPEGDGPITHSGGPAGSRFTVAADELQRLAQTVGAVTPPADGVFTRVGSLMAGLDRRGWNAGPADAQWGAARGAWMGVAGEARRAGRRRQGGVGQSGDRGAVAPRPRPSGADRAALGLQGSGRQPVAGLP